MQVGWEKMLLIMQGRNNEAGEWEEGAAGVISTRMAALKRGIFEQTHVEACGGGRGCRQRAQQVQSC